MNTLLLILMLGGMPFNLSTDLLADTRAVYRGGYHTSATLAQVQEAWRRGQNDYFQVSTIHSEHPRLAWQLPEGITGQTAYRILVASKADLLAEGKTDIWDSGDVESIAGWRHLLLDGACNWPGREDLRLCPATAVSYRTQTG